MTITLRAALEAILAEVEPGRIPYDADSYLPPHLVAMARQALDEDLREQVRNTST